MTIDETTSKSDLRDLLEVFSGQSVLLASLHPASRDLPAELTRTTDYLTHPVFNRYHSETDLLRYMYRLQTKDLS